MRALSSGMRFGLRNVAQLLSPAGRRAALTVLIYHRVPEHVDPLLPEEPDAKRFAAQMDLVAGLFNVLPLSQAVVRLKEGSLPARALCITFDDGYANNLRVAVPILATRGLPATVFVSTGFVGNGRMWNDTIVEAVRIAPEELDLTRLNLGVYVLTDMQARRAALHALIGKLKYLTPDLRIRQVNEIATYVGGTLPDNLMMSEEQLKLLYAKGIEIGAHTVNHPILAALGDDESRAEILSSKRRLEEIIAAPVTTFAYPNGRPNQDYESRHVRMARECGFQHAVSTAWGVARSGADVFQLPRIAPWDTTATHFTLRIIKSYLDEVPRVI